MENINTEDTKNFIVNNYLFGDDEKLNYKTSFLDEGIIDSTGILELIGFLEKQYKIAIHDDEIIPENMDSLEKLDKFITCKISTNQLK